MAFAYVNSGTFLKVPMNDAARRYAIAGIPWDGCVTNRPGARFGPRAVRQASHMLCDGIHPLFDVTPCEVLTDLGDLELPNTSLVAMRQAMRPIVANMLSKHHMVWIGGDHSVTLPLLQEYHKKLGRPLACIHFDAHCDTWEDHFGEPSGHGTWVYEAIQEKLLIPTATFQFGIRSSGVREAREFVKNQGGHIFTARELRGSESPKQLKEVIDTVMDVLKKHGNPPVYLTLDIDCLDPAFAPGTGTPEPGGMTSAQVLTLLEEFCASIPFVGMDCVEISPPYDHAELTSSAGSTFLWTYLCGLMQQEAAQ